MNFLVVLNKEQSKSRGRLEMAQLNCTELVFLNHQQE